MGYQDKNLVSLARKPEMEDFTEQELAYTLLVELMAYQFGSPVQWIRSQESIFKEKLCERLVEIGPSATLVNMARKTLDAEFQDFDLANSIPRQLMSTRMNFDAIYYRVDEISPMTKSTREINKTDHAKHGGTEAVPTETATPISQQLPPRIMPTQMVEDRLPTAAQIVKCIIAKKLGKLQKDINWDWSIKRLARGRSTVENELVGDLAAEFGSTPDGAEDIPVQELCAALQIKFGGSLGKQSSSIIAKMIASKMPGGFTPSTVKKYLGSQWPLGPGLQDGVLLAASSVQPANRLGSENAAYEFLDIVAKDFCASEAIELSAPAASNSDTSATNIAVDPQVLKDLRENQDNLGRQQMEVLARSLKLDLHSTEKAAIAHQKVVHNLQSQIDLWNTELGDFYASSIVPEFDRKKARSFSSFWNWAAQSALELFHEISGGRLAVNNPRTIEKYVSIVGKADQRLADCLLHLVIKSTAKDSKVRPAAKELVCRLLNDCRNEVSREPYFKSLAKITAPKTQIDERGDVHYTEIPRWEKSDMMSFVQEVINSGNLFQVPEWKRAMDLTTTNTALLEGSHPSFIFVKTRRNLSNQWKYDERATISYMESMTQGASTGLTFKGKQILITGAGPGSIGAQLVLGLLAGGAQIIVTTSRFSPDTAKFYQTMYLESGARNSRLVVVPFNQGSQQDIESLCQYIFNSVDKGGLGWDLDSVIPFAAISETGREIDSIDSKSEFAHRLMLTNTVRLLGSVKRCKKAFGSRNRPAQVILPLSANHGCFGSDGLYAESKLALESLFDRWNSESWSGYLSICGASMGWTRGTNLMAGNDLLSEGIERTGIRTFSQQEMAFAILCMLTPAMTKQCDKEPLFIDLNGGLGSVPDFKNVIDRLRATIAAQSRCKKAIAEQNDIEDRVLKGDSALRHPTKVEPCPTVSMEFPSLPDFYTEIAPLQSQLHGMVEGSRVVVITGFAEVGPFGNSRTRWEMEAYGEFSLEGCIEMAWIMGLIKNHNGPLKDAHYCGWVDAKTNEPVSSNAIKGKYEEYILEHTGIRIMEPDLLEGYDPKKNPGLHEIIVQEDLNAFEVSKEIADGFKQAHGDHVDVFKIPGAEEYSVKIKAGATLMVPKAMRFDNAVAGLIPTGWDARTYGIEEDIISQVDNVTLYVLVSTIEALLSSGITDPYEIYQYIHVSDVGNCIGSGLGGVRSQDKMYRGRFIDRPAPKDILSEVFINTTAAWVNMLLMSASGPIRTPVGACATSIESLELGYDTIVSGKAKICLVGGFDDLSPAINFEFGAMKAIVNADNQFAQGRSPKEMSRPATTTRGGFVESHGSGIQVLTTLELAMSMGLPIHGVVAWAGTASDKANRSVPAPGAGILTNAREAATAIPPPLLDIDTRKRRLRMRKAQIASYRETELAQLDEDALRMQTLEPNMDHEGFKAHRRACIEEDCLQQEKNAVNALGNAFWHDDARISPLRGALATWNLTMDDLTFATFHGTSTVMNDKNETAIIQAQLEHLGRKKGNILFAITQKYLTGHSKGAAGAWMLNGALQALETGLIPGNRNADDIDPILRQYENILFPNRSIQTDDVKAFSITAFGFGQKGAQALVVHPRYCFATRSKEEFEAYVVKRRERQRRARKYFMDKMINGGMFMAKVAAPYSAQDTYSVLLDPTAKLGNDGGWQMQFGTQ